MRKGAADGDTGVGMCQGYPERVAWAVSFNQKWKIPHSGLQNDMHAVSLGGCAWLSARSKRGRIPEVTRKWQEGSG